MAGSGLFGSVARAVAGSSLLNTLVLPPTVPVFFQRSPGAPGGAPRGIASMDYQVLSGGVVIQTGRTGTDGRVDVRVPPGGTSTVQLLQGTTVVAEYQVTLSLAAFDPVAQLSGQQQRLRHLGYQIGHTGATGDGVDNTQIIDFERSVLDFQVDANLLPDAKIGPNTRNGLTTQAGN